MAGYREFQTGEVLTAANVNSFLMEQATMTFADAAARDAALAGVLREGLLTYNLDTQRLEVYDGTDWIEPAPEPPAGIGSNVVSVTSDTIFATSSTSFVDVTGVTVTITPSSTQSRLLVMWSARLASAGNNSGALLAITDGDDNLLVAGAAEGPRPGVTAANYWGVVSNLERVPFTVAGHSLISPNTDEAFTVKMRLRSSATSSTTVRVGRTTQDADDSRFARVPTMLTVVEVAA